VLGAGGELLRLGCSVGPVADLNQALKRHLSELTGKKVDLVPMSALKPAYRRIFLNEVVYA
jgi:predicted nucleotidyltransferase